jgi:hypothetical protein
MELRETSSVSIVKHYFSHRSHVHCIPKSQMRQFQPPTPELLVDASCSKQIALLSRLIYHYTPSSPQLQPECQKRKSRFQINPFSRSEKKIKQSNTVSYRHTDHGKGVVSTCIVSTCQFSFIHLSILMLPETIQLGRTQ